MRTDIEFDANGTTLRGWLYTPEGAESPFPTIIMAHGFSALKEMGLDLYAEVFSAAGLGVLIYDNRNHGASGGEPRFDIDPVAQMRDYRSAITYAQSRPEVDAGRIGIWGTSYTGGIVLKVAALDKRVKCVVSQVPFINGHDNVMQVMPLEKLQGFYQMLDDERRSLAAGNPPTTIAICADDPSKPHIFPGRRTYDYLNDHAREKKLHWKNEVTVRSLDYLLEYDVTPFIGRISPTPLLMIVAHQDISTPRDIALRAFDQALEPKRVVSIPGDHYGSYLEEFSRSSGEARDWFVEHLNPQNQE